MIMLWLLLQCYESSRNATGAREYLHLSRDQIICRYKMWVLRMRRNSTSISCVYIVPTQNSGLEWST